MSRAGKGTDFLFRVGLVVKGVDSLFEIAGGVLLTTPTKLARFLAVVSQHELYRHHRVLSGDLDHLAQSVQTHVHLSAAIYLMVHGLVKAVLISAIFRGKRWGYTGLIGVLGVLSLFEIGRAFTAREVVTGLLAAFDLVLVILISKEYRANFAEAPEPNLSNDAGSESGN